MHTPMKSETQPASVVSTNNEETATPASEFLQTPRNCDRDRDTPLYTTKNLFEYHPQKVDLMQCRPQKVGFVSGPLTERYQSYSATYRKVDLI